MIDPKSTSAGSEHSGDTSSALPAEEHISTAEIDASLRWPLLAMFTCAAFWLLAGTALSLLAAIKMHKGDFLADCAWVTLGRVRPAALNAILYGFASQAALGVSFWLLCRLGNVRSAFQVAIAIGTKLWNIGVLVGVIAILGGASTGFEWLEMPRYAAGLMFAAYAVLGVCAVGTFQMRRVQTLYPTQWFIFAALFWFPWLYTAANYLLVIDPVRGTLQSVVAAWYAGGFMHLWLGFLCLGIIYYFVPKLSGQPLYSGQMAAFSFWSILIFGGWAGLASLQGAPVPRWVPAAGVAATLCLLVPLLSNAVNWAKTSCPMELFKKSPEARFISFGLVCYLLAGVAELTLACPAYQKTLGLTLAGQGARAIAIYGFIGSALLGAIYYILPRLVQVKWPSEGFIRTHFALHAAGALLAFAGLAVGGVLQGSKLADPATPFLVIAKGSAPFVGLATLGVFLMLVGHAIFAFNLVRLVKGFLEPLARSCCGELCGCGSMGKSKVGVKP